MSSTIKLKQAFLICLPILANYLLFMFLCSNGGDGATMTFGLLFTAPIALLGLPWSAASAFIEPNLRDHFSYKTLEHIATTLFFVSIFINATLLLNKVTFNKLFQWACILCVIQIVALLPF